VKTLLLISNVSASKITLCRGQNVACELRVERPCFRSICSQNWAHSIPKRFVSTPEDGSKDGLRQAVFQLKATMDKVQIRLRNASNHLQEPAEFNSLHFYLGTVTTSVVSQTNVHSIITRCYKLCFNIMLRPVPESKDSAAQRVQCFVSGGKCWWPDAENSSPSNAEIKKEWSYTSKPRYTPLWRGQGQICLFFSKILK